MRFFGMLTLVTAFFAISLPASAQPTTDPRVFMYNLCMQMGGAPQPCSCWAHTILGLMSFEDTQAVWQGRETAGSQYAMQEANRRCFGR